MHSVYYEASDNNGGNDTGEHMIRGKQVVNALPRKPSDNEQYRDENDDTDSVKNKENAQWRLNDREIHHDDKARAIEKFYEDERQE